MFIFNSVRGFRLCRTTSTLYTSVNFIYSTSTIYLIIFVGKMDPDEAINPENTNAQGEHAPFGASNSPDQCNFTKYFADLTKWVDDTRNVMNGIHAPPRIHLPFTFSADGRIRLPRHHYSYECQLASLWKRLVAEFIDGFILLLVKFYIIIILRDGFDITLKHYLAYLENPSMFFNFTTEIAVVEFVSRIIIFMYESYFLYTDGATPGKKIMGLRVYMVETICAIPGRTTVSAYPCKPLGWWRALIRSILKNIGLFIFPICYGLMITNSRAGYDHVTNTFVVDTSEMPLRLITNQDNIQVPNNYYY